MKYSEAKENFKKTLKEYLPAASSNILAALLIWLFGVLVFIPAAKQILPQRIPLITSLIVLIGFTFFILRSINNGLTNLIKTTAAVISFKYKNWKKAKIPINQLYIAFKQMLYIATTLFIYLLYSPFLTTINPALNGLVLIPIILWILWTIMNIINLTLLEK